jgi:hypothetical protein
MIDTDELGDEIATLAARLSAATHRLLTCIRRFDEAEGWHRQYAQSCAHWLTWRIGLDPATAREKVRVARALGGLPRIDEALRAGRLSYAQVRAITRVATPENEENILMIARSCTGAQLERICRRFRTARAESLGWMDEEAATDRRLRVRALGGGLAKLELVASADEIDLVIKAAERARDDLRAAGTGAASASKGNVTEATANVSAEALGAMSAARNRARVEVETEAAPEAEAEAVAAADVATQDAVAEAAATARIVAPPATAIARPAPAAPRPSAVDALVHLATAYLAGGSASRPAGGHQGSERYQVVLHLDRDLLSGEGGMAASLDDGTAVSAEALRRVACDAGLVPAVVDEAGAVLDIGRHTRAVPTAIRRALWLRDRGRRFPGCTNARFLHAHHVRHWLHGGRTSLDNLLLVCSLHHRLIHEGGVTLRFTDSGEEIELVTREGTRLPTAPAASGLRDAPDAIAVWLDGWLRPDANDRIDAWTATPTWDGENVDYAAAADALWVDAPETSQPRP